MLTWWCGGVQGIPVESGFARTAFEGAADVATLCLLALPFIHPSVELVAVSTMLLFGMSTMGENIAPYNTKCGASTALVVHSCIVTMNEGSYERVGGNVVLSVLFDVLGTDCHKGPTDRPDAATHSLMRLLQAHLSHCAMVC